jgi:hypothetical protein
MEFIELATKHYIYDMCISILCDTLNLNLINSNDAIPKPGEFYRRISHITLDEHYFECYITEVERYVGDDGGNIYIVHFNFKRAKGADFSDWEHHIDLIDRIDQGDVTAIDELSSELSSEYITEDTDYDDDMDDGIDRDELLADMLEEMSYEDELYADFKSGDVELVSYGDEYAINIAYYRFTK